jgi:magnesium-transporting ATPase (P-type)
VIFGLLIGYYTAIVIFLFLKDKIELLFKKLISKERIFNVKKQIMYSLVALIVIDGLQIITYLLVPDNFTPHEINLIESKCGLNYPNQVWRNRALIESGLFYLLPAMYISILINKHPINNEGNKTVWWKSLLRFLILIILFIICLNTELWMKYDYSLWILVLFKS